MCTGLAVALVVGVMPLASPAPEPVVADVFVGNAADPAATYPVYRIPAIVRTTGGTLLAFAEGRQGPGDQSGNDLVLRQSPDDGRTWSALRVVADGGEGSVNNPCAVVVTQPGASERVVLMYQTYPRGVGEYEAGAQRDERSVRSWVVTSDDAGLTWSSPRDLSEVVIPPGAATVATGPGCGIQLNQGQWKGRVVIPLNCRVGKEWTVYAVFSDDGGATWHRGSMAERWTDGYPNEVQFVEVARGGIMLNCRLQGGKERCRGVAVSDDGGAHWTKVAADERLVDPVCMGSLVRLMPPNELGPGVIAFSNPASASGRRDGRLKLSADEGRTWPVSVPIVEGEFAYSSLVAMDQGRVGCLYESGGPGAPIRFVVVKWAELGVR